jgi:teichuronic acid biosynthesis glycosyltransferase TuaG
VTEVLQKTIEKSSSPKISIIMPNFNKGKYLAESVRSVLRQSFQELELIVIDDASTDDSVEIVKRFQSYDARVKLIRQQTNRGVGTALNVGVRSSEGHVICFLRSDDILSPRHIEIQLTNLARHPKSVMYSDPIRIEENAIELNQEIERSKKLKTEVAFSTI